MAVRVFPIHQCRAGFQLFGRNERRRPRQPHKVGKGYYEGFDPDEEAYLWIGDDGHGRNGAPYHVRDIVADMEVAEGMVLDLLTALEEAGFEPM